jgi:hypothetical protein
MPRLSQQEEGLQCVTARGSMIYVICLSNANLTLLAILTMFAQCFGGRKHLLWLHDTWAPLN